MRKILGLLTLSLLLTSCTSNEGAVKKLALADGEAHYEEILQKEATDLIPQSDWLREAYVSYMKKNSEFEAEIKMVNETLAIASVSVATYSSSQRKTVAKIAGTVDPGKVRQFNFGNALQLISQQTGESVKPEKQNSGVFKYHKNSSGTWVLEK
ncbi:hypothetical protein [Bdellovibrio svalbardensis]|uniref:Lipoprotein n=1 Tax=Bdellovibrio svalbardensis TaxID=2972972 RepID=A0ABT6DS12_9BACT|nr:hypothetical protein [Bdellovibrio svalbardensis]MDG0817953.1 hypothetical protein [Bdellovibrio svalbardensis]